MPWPSRYGGVSAHGHLARGRLELCAYGLAQAAGVATVHYYTIFLKQRLGRDKFKAYNENRIIHAAAVVMTFCYYAVTLFLFANTLADMQRILAALQ